MGDHHSHGNIADFLDPDDDTPNNPSSLPYEHNLVPAVDVAQSSAHPRTVKPGLRLKFSRRFGSARAPREARPKALVRPKPVSSQPDTRFVDLRDRLVKIPVAVPTSIQRARPEPSTDQTMATYATSTLSDHSYRGGHRVNNGVDAEDSAVKKPSALAKIKNTAQYLFAPIFRWLRKGKEP
ncbi:MAG: hypothetical protein LQ350_003431 [Teloschistes chrysophthalmus]|nr:MAG: hypothetical protein LQ350_003431 [Niorma chrysophthalma]